jgi:hypothetical protein
MSDGAGKYRSPAIIELVKSGAACDASGNVNLTDDANWQVRSDWWRADA